MEFWTGVWTLFLYAGLFLFAALVVIVSFGAFFNVRDMFRRLARQHAGLPDDEPPPNQVDADALARPAPDPGSAAGSDSDEHVSGGEDL